MVREDFVVVVFDRVRRRQHVLYAARVEPGVERFALGLPASGRPEVQVLELDLPGVVHAISAPAEQRRGRSGLVAPARWATRGAEGSASAVELGAAGSDALSALGFDRGWSVEVAKRSGWMTVLEVVASGARPEAMTPVLRASWESDRPVLSWQEPLRRTEQPEDAALSAAAREPVVVESMEAEPAGVAPSAEAIGKVVRSRPQDLGACREAFADARPAEATTTRTFVVVGPRGQPMTSVPARPEPGADAGADATDAGAAPADAAAAGDVAHAALEKCVANALRSKQFPRLDRQWQFTATLRFVVAPAPARRTHLVLLGRERLSWTSPPGSVTLVRDLEPTWADLERALDAPLRAAIGLDGPPSRVWLTEYLDRSDQRHRSADIELALAAAPPPSDAPSTTAAKQPSRTARAHRIATRTWHALGALLVATASVALALALQRRT